MLWWYKLKIYWKTMKLLKAYGPDDAEIYARDISFEEMCERAVKGWLQEGFILLPNRFDRLAKQVIDMGLVTQEQIFAGRNYSVVIMPGHKTIFVDEKGQIYDEIPKEHQYSFLTDKKLLKKLSPELQNKIAQYRKDGDTFVAVTEAAFFWICQLEIEVNI